MFEQAFKRIDDVLRKEAGCTTELDYTEQTSWLLFLKYLDGLEQDLLAFRRHTDEAYRRKMGRRRRAIARALLGTGEPLEQADKLVRRV